MKSVSGKRLCQIIESRSWQLARISGSHYIYSKANHPTISIPVHGNKDLRIGTLKGLLKATGLKESDLS
jgi:predicted RNA binding protein YcfA (HicA-like mRNA interferase family)